MPIWGQIWPKTPIKSTFDYSFPEKQPLHCQILSEPKNLQSPLIIFEICTPGASFVGPKVLSTKHATFQKCPRKRPIPQKRFFWRGSDEKVLVPRALVLCPVDKNCSCRVIWSLVGCLVVSCGYS